MGEKNGCEAPREVEHGSHSLSDGSLPFMRRPSFGIRAETGSGYRRVMQAIPSDLTVAAGAARDRLSAVAREAAIANARPGSPAAASTMAAAAREAIFADALLAAVHARLEELKGVAK